LRWFDGIGGLRLNREVINFDLIGPAFSNTERANVLVPDEQESFYNTAMGDQDGIASSGTAASHGPDSIEGLQ
jgi:hypothetical protein